MSLQVNNPNIEPSLLWKAITPNDSTVLHGVRSVYIGITGNLTCAASDGTTVTFTAVPAGTVLPIAPYIIKATDTTADDIVALQ